jgi:cell division protein FtsB
MNTEQTTNRIGRKSRRKATKRKPILGMLPRFVMVGVILILTLGACFAFVAKIAQPYQMILSQGAQIRDSQSQLNDLRTRNQSLSMRRDYLQKPEGIEVAARSAGYLKPGEMRLVLENAPQPVPERAQDAGILDRFKSAWLTIVGR